MSRENYRVVVVDDDAEILAYYDVILQAGGFEPVTLVADSREAVQTVEETAPFAVIVDLIMPHLGGRELLGQLRERFPDIPVVVVTGQSDADVIVDCMKAGAFDFVTKPVDEIRLYAVLQHARERRFLDEQVSALSERLLAGGVQHPEAFSGIVTESEAMYGVFRYLEAVSLSPKPVFITGESGTGKELFAKAVHGLRSPDGPFVPVNVAGLEDAVFSDTLFGHHRGAFTGADGVRKGLVEQAAGGTLFLDEIGDLELASQVKLLRFLQEEEYYPLGSDKPVAARARVVVATNANLKEKIDAGQFRNDLSFRLMVHHVDIPPLRNRREDVPILVEHFLAEAAESMGKPKPAAPPELWDILADYPFPGNVRELQFLVYDATTRHTSGPLPLEPFRRHVRANHDEPEAPEPPSPPEDGAQRFSYRGEFPQLQEVEDYFIEEALRLSDGNQSQAARLLGVSQSTLSRWARARRSTAPV